MKLNWGTGLLIAIIISSLGIILLVALSAREKIDLVTEEYYPRELKYELEIEKLKNTRSLNKGIEIKQFPDSIIMHFPPIADLPEKIEGEILFYFPSDKYGDRTEAVQLDSKFCQKFKPQDFKPGKYEIIIDWKLEGKEYLQKELIFISN